MEKIKNSLSDYTGLSEPDLREKLFLIKVELLQRHANIKKVDKVTRQRAYIANDYYTDLKNKK